MRTKRLDFILRFFAMPKLKQALLWSFGLTKTFKIIFFASSNWYSDSQYS